MERQYRPIEPPKSKVVKYLKAFNYAFLTKRIKLFIASFLIFTTGFYYFMLEVGGKADLVFAIIGAFVVACAFYKVSNPSYVYEKGECPITSPKCAGVDGNIYNPDTD